MVEVMVEVAAADWQAQPIDHPALEAHYRDVTSFQAERIRRSIHTSRLAWSVAGAAMLANIGLSVAVATMLPLVRIAPVFLWTRGDGTVDSATSISDLPPTQSQAVMIAAVWQYVRDREAYSFADAQYRYDVVSAMSRPDVLDAYQRWFLPTNPDSPQLKFGRRGQVNIDKIGISFIRPQVALVRFWRTSLMYGATPARKTWSATVGFELVTKMPANTRLIDPAGLKIVTYMSTEDSP